MNLSFPLIEFSLVGVLIFGDGGGVEAWILMSVVSSILAVESKDVGFSGDVLRLSSLQKKNRE